MVFVISRVNSESARKTILFWVSVAKNFCLTFDDGLKSQILIAAPILKKLKLKAFFFIPTSILTERPMLFEVFRFFRDNYYLNFEQFYAEFLKKIWNVATANWMDTRPVTSDGK